MRRPYGLYTDRLTKAGHTVLRAGNVIDSVGTGPAELFGTRIGPRFMRGRQRIHTRDGGRIGVATGARLQYKFAHQSRYWWKFYNAARFELWRVDEEGKRTRKARTGPKVAYCLRDLTHTRPLIRRSPRFAHYPACSTNPDAQHVTIGTSPGWADIYPPAYPEQWIDVTGLRGCFAYVHIADPENGIFESNEDNNEAQSIIRLPYRSDRPRQGCRVARRLVTACGALQYRAVVRNASTCVTSVMSEKTLVVAEKPSVARDLASTLPGSFKQSKDKTHLERATGTSSPGRWDTSSDLPFPTNTTRSSRSGASRTFPSCLISSS